MDKDELLKELKKGQRLAIEMIKDADEQLRNEMTDEQWEGYKRFKKRHAKAIQNGNMHQAMNIVKEYKKKWQ